MPDFRADRAARDALAAAFGALRDAALAPFPRMADDPVRREPEDVGFEKIEHLLRWLGAEKTDNPSLAKWVR